MGRFDHCFPFVAVAGQDSVKLALLLCAVNPAIGGVLLAGEKGTAKSTLVRGLAALLWNTLVDHVTVYADERIVFSFMDGTEIMEML